MRPHLSRRPRPLSRPVSAPAAVAALALALALSGCRADATDDARSPSDSAPPSAPAAPRPHTAARALPTELPGLGPRTLARIPTDSTQALVVTGRGRNSYDGSAVLYERSAEGWRAGPVWPTHNGQRGWTDDHRYGDLRSPVGVFGLTDAGGLLADPGSRLRYDRSDTFAIGGTGLEGEPLAGSFDHVVAVNYNRVAGSSPLDLRRPQGAAKGGGIWVHVDHEGPTQGCVSLVKRHMRALVRALDPARAPVIVMGDAASLRR